MPTADSADLPLAPTDCGWAAWDRLLAGRGPDADMRVVPRHGQCSVRGCGALPVAAVQRAPAGSRSGFWQAYCAGHALARGVEQTEDGLGWTQDFHPLRIVAGRNHW